MKTLKTFGIILSCLLFLGVAKASAHVIVNPKSVGIGSVQTFTVSVPTEKDNPTVGLRLLIPRSVADVTPLVKPGWTITTKKNWHFN